MKRGLMEMVEISTGKMEKRLRYSELKKFIDIQITKEIRNDGVYHYVQNGMKPCELEDFQTAGIRDLNRDRRQFFHRLCPNMQKDDKLYKVKNNYHNHFERNSF